MTYAAQRRKVRFGFSMIELLIAITIMGILGVVVIGPFMNYLRRASETKTADTIQVIKQAINAYKMQVGEYPKSLEDLIRKPADVPANKWKEPFLGDSDNPMDEPPKDSWTNDFVYKLNPKGSKPAYQLYSWGPNGEGSPENEWIS
ncbi:hypothetical protein A3F66_06155 [candidate division TM6 bacterium RIFCSPHIGHO2_12_FULL_32_22]|nr:MAG: hypothetical protein A3F66_06155 [candidate division TM6 bacterium RIFCSPHIGHO2_12_FULL_32_22]